MIGTVSWEGGDDFNAGGRALYSDLHRDSDDVATTDLIVEACRSKDRLDRLHKVVSGDVDSWTRIFNEDGGEYVLKLDTAVSEVRQLATTFRHLLTEIQRRQGDVSGGGEDGFAGL